MILCLQFNLQQPLTDALSIKMMLWDLGCDTSGEKEPGISVIAVFK